MPFAHPAPEPWRRLASLASAGLGLLLLAAPAVLPGHAAAAPPETISNTLAPDASPQFRAVANSVMEAMAAAQVPGVGLGILADGREEVAGFGVANVETREPVTPDTRFQLGSITKTYTATALMRLVERGQVDLDAPVRTYLPEFRVADPDASTRVTVRNLLTHTGGWWGDAITDTGSGPDALENFLAAKLPTFPQLAPVGQYFSYNNTGLDVVGRIIEVVTGKSYREAMQALLLGPLRLDQSTFDPAVVLSAPHSEGHAATPDGPLVQHPLFIPRNSEPAGGLNATPHDVLRYARFSMGDGTTDDGTRLLEAATLRQMQSPQGPPPQAGDEMGLTWFVHTAGTPAFQHLGSTYGQVAQVLAVPERGLAIIVLTNLQPSATSGNNGGSVIQAAVRTALETYLPGGLQAFRGSMSAPPTGPIDLSEDELAAYAGAYGVPDLNVSLQVEDGTLVMRSTPIDLPDQVQLAIKAPVNTPDLPAQAPVAFLAPDQAVVIDPRTGTPTPLFFVRRPQGDIGWMSIGGLLLFPRTDQQT